MASLGSARPHQVEEMSRDGEDAREERCGEFCVQLYCEVSRLELLDYEV